MGTARTVVLVACLGILIASIGYWMLFLGHTETNPESTAPVTVACVGDSITEWSGYPTTLQVMLGNEYDVGNFGVAEAAVSTDWYKPYVRQSKFQESMDFQPSIVVIMLGTNDAHTYQNTDDFSSEYTRLVYEYLALENDPTVFLVKPPPIYENALELSATNLQGKVIPSIEKVANDLSLPTIDVNTALTDHPEFFDDGVHPNNQGAETIANEIMEAILLEAGLY